MSQPIEVEVVRKDQLADAIAEAVGDLLLYVHIQGFPADQWTVEHNLGREPQVSVVDSAGNVVLGSVQHVTEDLLTVSFGAAFSGRANCS